MNVVGWTKLTRSWSRALAALNFASGTTPSGRNDDAAPAPGSPIVIGVQFGRPLIPVEHLSQILLRRLERRENPGELSRVRVLLFQHGAHEEPFNRVARDPMLTTDGLNRQVAVLDPLPDLAG
jgi:hypothetical protein